MTKALKILLNVTDGKAFNGLPLTLDVAFCHP